MSTENPNIEVIQGLREAADWLEAHPELPRAHGLVSFHPTWGEDLREALTALARALGDDAVERTEDGYVYIEGLVATRVRVIGTAHVADLGGSSTPRYTPIIKPCPECRGAGGGGGYSVRTGLADPTTDEVCERCEGSGRETF